VSLDDFFSIGSSSIASAQNVFTNRTDEIDVFGKSLEHVAVQNKRPVALVEDLISPRTNVLVFYGFGGIGKTRLSRELERRYHHDAPDDESRLSFRVDFDTGNATDHEGILLGLRAVLGTFRPAWPAFDLALAVYWERAHPGLPMQEALNNSSVLRALNRDIQLGSQLQNAIEGMLQSYGGAVGIFAAGARVVGRSIRDRVRQHQLMRECPFFGPIVGESDPSAMRVYLGSLLAWELARRQEASLRRDAQLRLAVFFDTWERVQESESYRGGTEDLLSRLVYLMPNILFVITGRNQLRWAVDDSRARMQWAGVERWPFLSDGSRGLDPAQHLVGSLSVQDSDRFLSLRLQREGEAVIPPDVREVIISASQGVPLYLDLSAVRYAQMISQRRAASAADVGQPFAELVLRIMKDLNGDQRTLLRMASMVSRFDEPLLLAGSGALPHSSLGQFVRRSLVQKFPNEFLPYGLHEMLRDAVLKADIAEDRWSGLEWAAAAEKLSAEIKRRVQPELEASGSLDRALLAGYFLEAFRLAVHMRRIEPWVWRLAGRLHSLGAMDTLAAVNTIVPEQSPVRTASRALAAIASRRAVGPQPTADALQSAIGDPDLDETGREYLGYWLGWTLDDLGQWEAAERLRRRLAAGDGHFAPYLRHALARSDWVCGRLTKALSAQFDESDPLQRFWKTGIVGRVAWILGHFEEADEQYLLRIEAADEIGAPELMAHALRTRAELLCFTAQGIEEPALEAIEIYRRIAIPVSEAECRAALEIARCGRQDPATTLASLSGFRSTLGSAPHADVAAIFTLCVADDVSQASSLRTRLVQNQQASAYGYWADITGWWIEEVTGTPEPSAGSQVEWLHGIDDARDRWAGVMRTRRES
jgi:hypothetical protein